METLKYLPQPFVAIVAISVLAIYFVAFIRTSSIEGIFLSKEARFLKLVIKELLLFLLIMILYFTFKFSYRIHLPINIEFILLTLTFIIQLIANNQQVTFIRFRNRIIRVFTRKNWFSENAFKLTVYFLLFLIHWYLIVSFICDMILWPNIPVDLLGLYTNLYNKPEVMKVNLISFFLIFISIYLLSRPFMSVSFRFFNTYVYRKEYKVTVHLSDAIFEDHYLFAPTYGKMILIGEKPLLRECENIIAIQRDKITYIKVLVSTIVFEHKRYTIETNTSLKL